jgi:hypothetical protein
MHATIYHKRENALEDYMKKINILIMLTFIVFGSATSAFAMSESATECADGSGVSRSHVDSSDSSSDQPGESTNSGNATNQ